MFPRSYKDPIPKDIVSGVVYNFQCDLCNESYYGESIRHLDIRSGNTNSATYDHLLHCDCLPPFDNFSILAHENRKHLLEIKESLLIMRDKASLNRNIKSAPLYLFDKVSEQVLDYFTLAYLIWLVYFLLNIIIKL